MITQYLVNVIDSDLGVVGRLFAISTGEGFPDHGSLATKSIQAGLLGGNWDFQFKRVDERPRDIPVQIALAGANAEVWFLNRASPSDAE